ncbi:Ketosamine-3-kinase [Ceratocystis platani]|uniref:protein-ribulosamine 3-kinase n=1 Tax=Ceratocystis fimbriata f. sp. platani TaxID=88771 RepID=A0A0F8B0R4_CERFI|nr:Ketosamine-3-kinase [Ceratocystis platani]
MAPEAVDPAILESLGLEDSVSTLSRFGSSAFATSYRLDTEINGEPMVYFVKSASGPEAEVMFQGTGATLAVKLATLHTTPAPIPYGARAPMYGFHVTTCCGCTEQENTWKSTWSEFFAECRLRAIMRNIQRSHGNEEELMYGVEAVAETVVPRLLGEQTLQGIYPVVVHGDLWSGNYSQGILHGREEEVVYDAACVYGHSEYDLGIMKMFGGFGMDFWQEYQQLVPPHEPQEEFNDRLQLYELYHYLNHYAMYGGGYKSSAFNILRDLLNKYAPP